MKTKIIFVLFLLSVVCAKAQYSGGNGTQKTPYLISTPNDLIALADTMDRFYKEVDFYLGKYFLMTNDIDVQGIDPSGDGSGFPVIGWGGKGFAGNFNGNNYKIKNLHINRPAGTYVGFFGCIAIEGKVSHLIISDGSIIGGNHVGTIAGINRGWIDSCENFIEVRAMLYEDVGGIVGGNQRTGIISNCTNAGRILGNEYTDYVGGIVGYSDGSIKKCTNIGNVIGHGWSIGGIAGQNNASEDSEGLIEQCANLGRIESGVDGVYIGGVVGDNFCMIKGCYNLGEVIGNTYVGGITGDNGDYLISAFATLENSFNSGHVHGEMYVGGIAGWNENNSSIENVYNAGEIIGTRYVGGISGRNGDTTHSGSIIKNAYNIGNILANDKQAGIVAENNITDSVVFTVNMNFWRKYDSARNIIANNMFGIHENNLALDESQYIIMSEYDSSQDGDYVNREALKIKATYENLGWDFHKDWKMGTGLYPYPHVKYNAEKLPNQPDCPPLIIVQQPENIMVTAPKDTAVTVIANSLLEDLHYRWRKISAEGQAIVVGDDSPMLLIQGLLADTGRYFVRVYSACKEVISDTFSIYFQPLDSIVLSAPEKICIQTHDTANVMSFPENINRSMYFTSSDTTILSVDFQSGVMYAKKSGTVQLAAISVYGEMKMQTITVVPNAKITRVLHDSILCPKQDATLTVGLDGEVLKFEWYRNNHLISESNDTVLLISARDVDVNDQYKVIAASYCQSDTIDNIQLNVLPLTTILEQPESMKINELENLILAVKASGHNLTYQWKKEGNDIIEDADQKVYWVEKAALHDAGKYTVEVTGSCGIENSREATVRVIPLTDGHKPRNTFNGVRVVPSIVNESQTFEIQLGVSVKDLTNAEIQIVGTNGVVVKRIQVKGQTSIITSLDVSSGLYVVQLSSMRKSRKLNAKLIIR